MASTLTATDLRFHVGLHTANLDEAVRFYRLLFGLEPAKYLADYAKFEMDQPPLVLALYPNPQPVGGALNHVGLRFPDSSSLVAIQHRLEAAGITTQRQEGVECCYAKQTKFWVTDPDRVLWEIYTLEGDIEHSGFDDAPLASAVVSQQVWQHRLTDPLPERLPFADAMLDEVLLEGTFNSRLGREQLVGVLVEAMRVLKPGGAVRIHGLVGDKPFPGEPKLPGMASLVQRVPVETEPLAMLKEVGFVGMTFEKLGDIHCFSINGVELRELRLLGRKPAKEETDGNVVYKGPFAEVTDEFGTLYPRGKVVRVEGSRVGLLKKSGMAEHFTFLSE